MLREKLPYFILSALSCVMTFHAQVLGGAVSSLAHVSLAQRTANALLAYATYLGRTFWPSDLAIFYPLRGSMPVGAVMLAGVVLLGVTAWALFTLVRTRSAASLAKPCSPWRFVGWCWFVGMLVPVIGLVQVGTQQMADRYTYLPLIGVFLLVVWEVTERLGGTRYGRGTLITLGSVILLACVVLTSRQLAWWRDSERLFQRALAVTRDNYMAHNNLAGDYFLRGKWGEAIEHYQASLALQPTQPQQLQIRYYLGEAMINRGRYAEAADQFAEVLRVRPADVEALVQLGIARARQNNPQEALRAFAEALRLQPDNAAAHNSFGNVLAQQGRHEEAVRQFEEALRLKPEYPGALNNLAISCKKLGRMGEAIGHYREAIRLQPDALEALNNLAWILAACPDARYRNGAEAIEMATRACELTRYQNPITLVTVAAAYGEAGKFREAISFAEQAQVIIGGSGNPLVARLKTMIESFRAGKPYHSE